MCKALFDECVDRSDVPRPVGEAKGVVEDEIMAEISAREEEHLARHCGRCGEPLDKNGSCPLCEREKLEEVGSGNWVGITCAIMLLCLPAFGQAKYSGLGLNSGPTAYGTSAGGELAFYAALPIYWMDNTICDPPGGVYDTTVILGTTNNIGPNVAGSAIGTPYALTYLGLLDAMNNWRDNADNASQSPHFADKWWLIEVPAGTLLHGNSYDANDALVSLPGKLNGGTEPAKCLVVDSTTPLTPGVMACGRGLPGFGGARNPGCASPNDKASMWKVQLDSPASLLGRIAIYAGADLVNPATNYANHIVLRDVEVTEAPGAAQGGVGVKAGRLVYVDSNPFNTIPCYGCQHVTHFGLDRYYVHGWDPGDPGQPTTTTASITNVSANGTNAVYSASNAFLAAQLVTVSGLTGGDAVLNCTACIVISTGLSGSQFELANANTVSSNSVSGASASQVPVGASPGWTNAGYVTVA